MSRAPHLAHPSVYVEASTLCPFLGKVESTDFLKALSATEIALGVALLLPVVPTVVVDAGVAAAGVIVDEVASSDD